MLTVRFVVAALNCLEGFFIFRSISLCYGASFATNCQILAKTECPIANTGDAIGNEDVGQIPAIDECHFANTGDTIGDDDTGQILARTECPIANTGDTVGDGDAGHITAIVECVITNGGDTVGDDESCIPFSGGICKKCLSVFAVQYSVYGTIVGIVGTNNKFR